MTIVYEVDEGLYLNITNRCTNRCEFCIRNNGDGAYGSDSLWLEHEPTREEIVDAVFSRDLEKYSEVVFCGYGEPTVRLDDMRYVALKIKEKHPALTIRVNTNGHSDLIHGKNTAPSFADAFDVVSVSLNTPNSQKYEQICHSVYKEKAFSALLTFTENVKNYVQKTLLSVVRQSLTEDELSECYAIAEKIGVSLKVRDYISSESGV
ncbi:MAG: radical SAM protein [Clostridia bacterium]|nr:radical SAM protein [Clostridia bacterium]